MKKLVFIISVALELAGCGGDSGAGRETWFYENGRVTAGGGLSGSVNGNTIELNYGTPGAWIEVTLYRQ